MFFEEQLLKLGIYAEKIVIYLTPYVLKSNVKLLIFDYGKEYLIETKKFLCHLPNKNEIVTLYRKCHYDAAYGKSYVTLYQKYIRTYESQNDNLKVLTYYDLDSYRKNNQSLILMDYENMQSVRFTNKKIEKNQPPKIEAIKEVIEEVNSNNTTKINDESFKNSQSSVTNASNINTTQDEVFDINSYEIPEVDTQEKSYMEKYKAFLVESKEYYKKNTYVEILKHFSDCKNFKLIIKW